MSPARLYLRLDVRIGRRTRAHEIPVAVRALDPRNRWPELGLATPRRRERRALAAVEVRPHCRRHAPERMRRVLEDVVHLVGFARLDLSDLVANRDQGVAEPVQLLLRLAFRRLDHE